jgi:phosphatidylserine/phosphatidylglycerophosphate/cardiolipin synthase-like enzyme
MTYFVSNDDLWREIQRRVGDGKRVRAAVAYLGSGGATLLPLKRGDSIVVDMSIGAVRQGVTDPREIRTLVRRGVKAFSGGSLHAKFLLVDNTLIVSSANISHNSKEVLDEAGVITTDSATVRRASEMFDKLCTEPIGKEYLKTCIAEYRPPKFKAAGEHRPSRSKRSRRIVEAKLWFLGGLKALSLSDVDRKSVEQVERHHQTKLSRPEQTELTWIRYHRLPKALRQVRVGDWIVDCQKDGRGRYVGPPQQMLGFDKWVSDRGTRYTLMMLEVASAGEVMSLTDFRRKVVAIQPELNHPSPRSRPIVEKNRADDILRMWTSTGRVAKRRQR